MADETPDVIVTDAPEVVDNTIEDESVTVTVINEAPEEPHMDVLHDTHCEHCAAHEAEIADLRSRLEVVTVLAATEPEPEPEPMPEPEPEEPVKEEVQPAREHPLNRRVFGGGE